jgi:hypothetical protein
VSRLSGTAVWPLAAAAAWISVKRSVDSRNWARSNGDFSTEDRMLMSMGSEFFFYKVGWVGWIVVKDCGLPEQASMKFEIGLPGSNTSSDCGDRCHDGSDDDRYLTDLTFVKACRRPIVPHALLI